MSRGPSARGLFAVLLLGNLAVLTWRVRIDSRGLPGADRAAAVLAGSRNAVHSLAGSLRVRVDAALDPAGVRAERDRYRDRIARLEWELTVQRGLLDRARGFTTLDRELFDVGEPLEAEIAGLGAGPFDRSLTLNRGSDHGVFGDAPVMAAEGLVGRVVRVAPRTSQVDLLTAPESAVAALTASSRSPGIVRAAPADAGGALSLDYVSIGHGVAVGETVISSGADRLFPKGLPIGVVSAIDSGNAMLVEIWVEPLVDMERLERVFILPPVPPGGPWASR